MIETQANLTEYLTEHLQNVLRDAGVEVGYVGGEAFRAVVAERMAPEVARMILAAKCVAWAEGFEVGHDALPGEGRHSNPYRTT